MGKRQIGELQVSEFIITILLSEIASVPIIDKNSSILDTLLPILYLLTLETTVSFILMKSRSFRRLFIGTPSLLIVKGEIDQRALRDNRIEIEELLSAIRQNGYASPDMIQYAILEENGRISVIPKAVESPLTPKDIQLCAKEKGMAHPLILDGTVLRDNLRFVHWNEMRLEREVRKRKLKTEDIFLFTVDDDSKICIIPRCIKVSKKDHPSSK